VSTRLNLGGIVLAGGRSTRMGRSKAHLPFGGETMLARTVRQLGNAVGPVVVVGAPDQELPPLPLLPNEVSVARDDVEGRGPLAGILAGLEVIADRVDAVFVCGCDTPLLSAAFVRRVADRLGENEVSVPHVDGFWQPLAAVYRVSVAASIRALLEDDQRRPAFLFDRVPTRRVERDELLDVDPELWSLRNLNRPDDVAAALRDAGIRDE